MKTTFVGQSKVPSTSLGQNYVEKRDSRWVLGADRQVPLPDYVFVRRTSRPAALLRLIAEIR